MNYSGIQTYDIANGIGVRLSLFVSGCTNHCEGCFQPETWDFNYGEKYTKDIEDDIVSALKDDVYSGLTILGGEPFEPSNQEALYPLIVRVKKEVGKSVWMYTGFSYDTDLQEGGKRCIPLTERILALVDVLVDGRFSLHERDISLAYRGSRNQRIIDVQASIKKGEVVLMEEYM